MNLKSFFRGIGVGMIVSAIVFFAVYNLNDKKAENQDHNEKIQSENTATTEDVIHKILNSSESPESSDNTTQEITTEQETSQEETTQGLTEEKKEESTTEKNKDNVVVDIKKGMVSSTVAQMLEAAGAVDDADKFDKFLNDKGYAKKVNYGKHKIEMGLTYEQLAKKLMNQ